MSDFQVNRAPQNDAPGAMLGRVIVSFVLFVAGLVLIGVGATADPSLAPFVFTGGIVAVGLAFGLPMIGGSER
ncbi:MULTISPECIES: hypothetical protein [Isoptericola]|uniref:Uncharacterized protein n=1 Tax=Isoptericola sediminis TaxID=2733572 RepID=A0A849JXB9_9MICO|nr:MULTISPECIES: hypothetical protein [Isoptericola]MDO8143696.1 hypothetical protein [Isoptericola sp. 178]MDO8147593.1 hypothetical protein [Isoptericola sp. b515]MDO8150103.1 hypothetical protein [Isoptericola sp. b408]NNU27234.1 hypothetical protein [Isoptericola sediminis]